MAHSILVFNNQTMAPAGDTVTSSIYLIGSAYGIPWHRFYVTAEAGASCSVRVQISPSGDASDWMTWTEAGSGTDTATVFGTAAALPPACYMARELAWGNTTATVQLTTWITTVGPSGFAGAGGSGALAGDVIV